MPTYSRDAAVAAVRTYYTFLAADLGAIPGTSILEPPVGGWRNITTTAMAPLGKTDEVVDLLRHLPYIEQPPETCGKIAFETRAIRYNDTYELSLISRKRLDGIFVPPGAGILPAHVAVLSDGARYGSWLLLDTKEGTITDFIQQERPERAEPLNGSPDYWRAYTTRPIGEFFVEWEQNFRSLSWVVNPYNFDDGMMLRHDQEANDVRQIYRDHGWPDNFRRADCQNALLQWNSNH